MSVEKAILELEKINKTFPGVKALDNVSISVNKGEVRGLVGENGAGKSTLIKIITGKYTKDSGIIKFNGNIIEKNSPLISKKLGIYAVYQDVTVAPDLSVAENFFLGDPPKTGLFISWRKMHEKLEDFLKKEIGTDIKVEEIIKNLSLGEREMISIIKALWSKPKLVIFDEPTAALTSNETKILFHIIERLRKNNTAVIYISHNLEEVFELCDTVTVLKDGKVVGTYTTGEVGDVESLIPLMVGRTIKEMYPPRENPIGKEILKVENISGKGFKNINFSLRSGELVGLYGLIGAGRTEIAKAIYGLNTINVGKITFKGSKVLFKNPKAALTNGITYLPEDRRKEGLFLQQDVNFNINISNYDKVMRGPLISYKLAYRQATNYINQFSIKIGSLFQPVGELSGGNQQKVIMARGFCKNADIYIFDEPTVGIDVGTKVEIYKFINNLLNQGKGIIFISSYLPELIGISDRIYVVSQGEIAGEVDKKDFSEEYLLKLSMKNVLSRGKKEEAISNV